MLDSIFKTCYHSVILANGEKMKLEKYCKMSKHELFVHLVKIGFTMDDGYAFKDNGSQVLGVAHLDVAGSVDPQYRTLYNTAGDKVYSPSLDDRLGIYILLEILPRLGVSPDILITDFEEIGDSTAKNFVTEKQYNWMFQFDRRGTDVVMYQYHTEYTENLMELFNFEVGYGSFSDICYLDGLGCVGFNFGTAYYNEHTLKSYAVFSELDRQVEKFIAFYNQYSDVFLEYFSDYERETFLDTWLDETCEFCEQEDIDTVYYYHEDVYLCRGCAEFLNLEPYRF